MKEYVFSARETHHATRHFKGLAILNFYCNLHMADICLCLQSTSKKKGYANEVKNAKKYPFQKL